MNCTAVASHCTSCTNSTGTAECESCENGYSLILNFCINSQGLSSTFASHLMESMVGLFLIMIVSILF